MASCTFLWIVSGLVSPGPSGLGRSEKTAICSRVISRISESEGPQESLRAPSLTPPPKSGPIASHYGGPAASSGQRALELLAVPSPTVGSPSVRRMIRETLPEGSSSSRVALSSSCTAISIALLMLVPEGHTFSAWLPGGVQCLGSLHLAGLQRHSPPWAWMPAA